MKLNINVIFFSILQFIAFNNYGQVTLPWTEGFENVGPEKTFYNDSYPINGLPNWSYDMVNFRGRLNFQKGSGFYHSGTHAATLDRKPMSYFLVNNNFLILELDMSSYTLSTDLVLSFYHMHHSDLYVDDYDKVWIRGSNKDRWIQIYNLAANQGSAGTWRHTTGLDIDLKLAQANPPQKVTSTFQVRFGQCGFNSTVNTEYYQGRTFDDITITGTNCGHPPEFSATAVTSNSVGLTWTKNYSNHDVLIAVNSSDTFGNPVNGVTYTLGNTLTGGGTVIYAGSDFSFLHSSQNANEHNFYKAWSYNETHEYSCGITGDAITPCESINTFPYNQNFENGGTIPSCWSQEYSTGDQADWVFTKGNRGKAHPSNAHSGDYNACLQDTDDEDDITLLITPPFDLSSFASATISFWHTQEYFIGNQDELKIYYRTSAGSNWILLNSYSNNISSWTNESISLPDLSNAYYIAFEGNARYGYGICIDDFSIDGILVTYPIADFLADTLTPAIGDTVTFTDLSTNNPTSWSWTFDPVTVTYVNGTNATSQNPKVQFDESGNYTVDLTASNASGNDIETKVDYISVQNPVIIVDLIVFLEGPFDESGMIPKITDVLPLNQPYNIQPWNYSGSESVVSLPVPDIIDWVLVELRDAPDATSATPSAMIGMQAAFILNNGKIVGPDGFSNLQFNYTIQHQLFVVVYHRNHLSIMSSSFLTKNGEIYLYNFTDGLNKAYGVSNNGQKEIGTGIWGMYSGDGDRNRIIEGNDKSVWGVQSGTQGYLESDYNLDKESNNLDKNDFWFNNLGLESQIPN